MPVGLAGGLMLLLPLTLLVEVELVGRLFLHDLVSVALLPMLLLRRWRMGQAPEFMAMVVLIALWTIGAIVTDLYRGTAFDDLARGWSRTVLFGVHLATLWFVSNGRIRLLGLYIASLGVVLILQSYFMPSEYAVNDPWKFGVGTGLLFLTTGLAAAARNSFFSRYLTTAVIAALALVSLLQGSRALFAIAALASAYIAFATWAAHRPQISRRITATGFTLMILVGLALTQVLAAGYGYAAESGMLGEAARQKYIWQGGGEVSILLGGRSEALISVEAISDSPLLGHGSWAQDPYYVALYFHRLAQLGIMSVSYDYYVATWGYLIPAHSHLLGTWVEHGILASIVWIWVIVLAFRALFGILKIQEVPAGLVTFTAMAVLWDVLFSPYGGEVRIVKAAQVCVLLAAVTHARSQARGGSHAPAPAQTRWRASRRWSRAAPPT